MIAPLFLSSIIFISLFFSFCILGVSIPECILYHWFDMSQCFFCTSDADCGVLYSFITYLCVCICPSFTITSHHYLTIILWLSAAIYTFLPCGALHVLARYHVVHSTFLLGCVLLCLVASGLSGITWFCQWNVNGHNVYQIQPAIKKIVLEYVLK